MRDSRTRVVWIASAVEFLVLNGVGTARAEKFVSGGWNMAVSATANVSFDCKNSPGPKITLEGGQIKLGPLAAEITLANNKILTHHTEPGDIVVDAAIQLDMGGTVQIPKQPSRSASYYGSNLTGTGVGGNPYIFAQLYDQNGKALTDPIFLGRCVQGGAAINANLLEAVLATATIAVDSNTCTNHPGPFIYINNGLLSLSGVSAQITFTNNAKFTHVAQGDATVSLDIIVPGGQIVWPKQPPLGGAGGNPLVYFIFKKGTGETADDFVGTWPGQLLGRCNKL